jgi:hypothetical protein
MPADPAAVVAWFGAVQAQDYAGAKWALALRAPALTDAVSAGISGLATRRLQLDLGVSASHGDVGTGPQRGHYLVYQGRAGLNVALSRMFGIQTDYSYHAYESGGVSPSDVFTGVGVRGHSFRVALAAWLPLINRVRRSNAAG